MIENAIGTHDFYIIPSVSEAESVRYARRTCSGEHCTIHFHEYKRDGYRVACAGYGCYSLIHTQS